MHFRFQQLFATAALASSLLFLPLAVQGEPELNQQELNQRADKDFQASDAELNRVYKALTKKLTGTTKNKLIESQTAWLKFRDAEANARASEFEGGSMAPMIYAGSRNHTTKARVADLKEWLESYR